MNWRPEEGWNEIKIQANNELLHRKSSLPIFDDDYIEAGADAGIKALVEWMEKRGHYTLNSYTGDVFYGLHTENWEALRKEVGL